MRTLTLTLTLLSIALGLCAWGLRAAASAGVSQVSLEEGVAQATCVLLVEKAEPAAETLKIQLPYVKDGQPARAEMPTEARRFKILSLLGRSSLRTGGTRSESYLHPGQEHGIQFADLCKPGALIRVVDSQTVMANQVALSSLAFGRNRHPLFHRLSDRATDEQIAAAKRFVLLVGYNTRYESYVGIAGHGLLTLDKKQAVETLLSKRGRRPTR